MELIVTNLQRKFTGISATTASVVRRQAGHYDMRLVGTELPGCPEPVSAMQAVRLSRQPSPQRLHVIWHVRRRNEMRAALFARDLLSCPIKIVYTASSHRPPSLPLRWMMSRMDSVIGTTRAAVGQLPNVRAIIHHGVDTELYHPAEDRLQAWLEMGMPGQIAVATVGQIRPEKGTDLFVEAMLGLLPHYPEVTALVIGAEAPGYRSFETRLRQRVEASGLGERFLFTGNIEPQRVPQLVRSLSLLVAPSRYQGFSLAPLEAMASGVPVIATDTGYHATFIGRNEAGMLVREPTTQALAKAIDILLKDPLRRGALNATARERAVAHFSVDNEVRGITRVYDDLWRSD